MKKIYSLMSIIAACYVLCICPYSSTRSIDWWYNQMHQLHPTNKKTLREYIPLTSFEEFIISIDNATENQKQIYCNAQWTGNSKNISCFSEAETSSQCLFSPFVAKIKIPQDAHIYMWGDLHGDIASLIKSLYFLYLEKIFDDSGKIQAPYTYFFFLGDFVDRGNFGVEVLMLLCYLSMINPEKVFLIRGNHEELGINAYNGFYAELTNKYGSHFADSQKKFAKSLLCFYNSLPVALFVECKNNIIQCCHGGIEIGYDPTALFESNALIAAQLIEELKQKTNLKRIALENATETSDLLEAYNQLSLGETHEKFTDIDRFDMLPQNMGFMWNDFNTDLSPKGDLTSYNANRGFMFGKILTEASLNFFSHHTKKLRAVFRGHQHNNTMKELFEPHNNGLYSIFNNTIFTTVSTNMFNFGPTFIKLNFAHFFNDWQLERYTFINKKWQLKKASLNKWE